MCNSTLNYQLSTNIEPLRFLAKTPPLSALSRGRGEHCYAQPQKIQSRFRPWTIHDLQTFQLALYGGYNKKRMRRINGAFAFVVLSLRSRLIGWGGIPRMLPLLRRMPSRGGCKVVQLRGCDLRHVARTSGRRRRGTVHFPSPSDV